MQKPDNWKFKEDREIKGKVHKIYEVEVKDPQNCFGVAEVAILGEGDTNNEGKDTSMAKPLNWEEVVVPFEEDLRDFLDEMEKDDKDIFATSVENVSVADELAEVMVYNKIDKKDVSADLYAVRRRKGKFQFRKIINQTSV